MAWNKAGLDPVLVPLAVGIMMVYNLYLQHKCKRNPLQTVIGVNNLGKRAWVHAMMKTLRNSIMASTLMASTAILLSTGLAAFISSTYSIKAPIQRSLYGANADVMLPLKFVTILVCILFSFICYMQSIRFVNHVNYLINIPVHENTFITPDYVADILIRGSTFYCIGTRGFYTAFPLVLWIFGPIPVILSSLVLVPFLYNLDFVKESISSAKSVEVGSDKGCFWKSSIQQDKLEV
ncbi:hypothetical protein O6H91_22G028000 [Diphasiastrum complanatum]|uniref:Uncharacterized protein n=1 Tax=Diphasiastrum complanatum TaxID=34168 RepID=A0ACC2ADZ9_DIPCM|nr:hypothetical protein O6H91_22G028000 [Diphasiastrum complanatum]